jgi:hypothetical protein
MVRDAGLIPRLGSGPRAEGRRPYAVICKIKTRAGSGTSLFVPQFNRLYIASQAIGDQEAAVLYLSRCPDADLIGLISYADRGTTAQVTASSRRDHSEGSIRHPEGSFALKMGRSLPLISIT